MKGYFKFLNNILDEKEKMKDWLQVPEDFFFENFYAQFYAHFMSFSHHFSDARSIKYIYVGNLSWLTGDQDMNRKRVSLLESRPNSAFIC